MSEPTVSHLSGCCQNDSGVSAHTDTVRDSFEDIYTQWYPQVIRWARRRCADPQDAEDVAQQVFADVWHHSGRYCPRRGGIGPWLYGITAHKAADASSAAARRLEGLRRLMVRPGPKDPDVGAGTVERVHMASSLAGLSNRRREVLFLAYYLDLTQPEVARHLGLPLGTVKSHTRRALRALACLLDERA
ncbi:RNA polymerase sigma factor [Streptomyces bacillaris]|uniref:RNA polymerase sigma factor n=1 Tax=Streptomyces bacillaris TaxID=68179 RepID=UPI003466587F